MIKKLSIFLIVHWILIAMVLHFNFSFINLFFIFSSMQAYTFKHAWTLKRCNQPTIFVSINPFFGASCGSKGSQHCRKKSTRPTFKTELLPVVWSKINFPARFFEHHNSANERHSPQSSRATSAIIIREMCDSSEQF